MCKIVTSVGQKVSSPASLAVPNFSRIRRGRSPGIIGTDMLNLELFMLPK
jgi:hypothetical protein